MKPTNSNLFIEPIELIKKINNDPNFNYKIFDATFYLPNSGLDAEQEFNGEHIKNSAFFLSGFSTKQSTFDPSIFVLLRASSDFI